MSFLDDLIANTDFGGFAPAASDTAFGQALLNTGQEGGSSFSSSGSNMTQPQGTDNTVLTGIQGVEKLLSGVTGMNQAKDIANRSDPFAQYRPYFGDQLMQLYGHPENVTKLPGFQAGLVGVERSMASQGYNGSGNMMAALAQYGGQFFDKAIQQLAGLSGATTTPGNGQQLATQTSSGGQENIFSGIGDIAKVATSVLPFLL